MTFPSLSKNVFVINDPFPFMTCTQIEYLLLAFSFVIIVLFLNSKYSAEDI